MGRRKHYDEATLQPAVLQIAPPLPDYTYWVVEQTCRVPTGELSSYFTLPAGKVISSKGYDIEKLRALGVPMRPVVEGAVIEAPRVVLV